MSNIFLCDSPTTWQRDIVRCSRAGQPSSSWSPGPRRGGSGSHTRWWSGLRGCETRDNRSRLLIDQHQPLLWLKLFLKERENVGTAEGISVKIYIKQILFIPASCGPACQLPQQSGTKPAAPAAASNWDRAKFCRGIRDIPENRQNILYLTKPRVSVSCHV